MKGIHQQIFKLLPIVGISLVIIANIISAIIGAFTTITIIGVVLGLLFFLTVFLRFESANVRYYLNVSLYTLFALGIVVFIYLLLSISPQRWDVTKAQFFSLSPQSRQFLKSIDKEVKIASFTEERRAVEDFLRRYSYASKKIKYEIHNPFKDTLIAREYDTNVISGDSFVLCGKKKKKIHGLQERDFTNAIAEVVREGETIVYFLQGHGERALESSFSVMQRREGDPSLSEIKRLLTERAIGVKELKLAEKGFVPEDCSVLVCAAPTSDLFPVEVDIIKKYLLNGGRAIFMIDAVSEPMMSFERFTQLFKEFGVVIKRDIVVDMNPISQALYGDPLSPLVYGAGEHPILKDLPKNQAFFVTQTRTVSKADSLPEDTTVEEILRSSEYSWSEDVDRLFEVRKISPPERDKIKAQSIAVAAVKKIVKEETSGSATEKSPEARMVVFGDSDMFANTNISSASALIFLNAINWLTELKEIIAIPEKLLESTPVILSAAQTRLIFITLVITLPSIVFFGGLGYTMLRRRAR